MTATREQLLASTFVELADNLVDDFDVVDLTVRLTERCVELLDAAAAGLLLRDSDGALRLMAATSEAAKTVELFQIQTNEGPCRDCVHSGSPISAIDLQTETSRWPRFAPVAVAAGFRSAHAFPLRLRGQVLGALNLFRVEGTDLPPADIATAQAFADVATIALLQDRVVDDAQRIAGQLQEALNSRVTLEQAKGIVSGRSGCDMDAAFAALRQHARNTGQRLTSVAQDVIDGALDLAELRTR